MNEGIYRLIPHAQYLYCQTLSGNDGEGFTLPPEHNIPHSGTGVDRNQGDITSQRYRAVPSAPQVPTHWLSQQYDSRRPEEMSEDLLDFEPTASTLPAVPDLLHETYRSWFNGTATLVHSETCDLQPSRPFTQRQDMFTRRTAKSTRGNRTKQEYPNDSEEGVALNKAKVAHSVVERRYRDNLNGKFIQLHHLLTEADLAGTSSAFAHASNSWPSQSSGKVQKSQILSNAIEYVQQAKSGILRLSDQVQRLRDKQQVLEDLSHHTDFQDNALDEESETFRNLQCTLAARRGLPAFQQRQRHS